MDSNCHALHTFQLADYDLAGAVLVFEFRCQSSLSASDSSSENDDADTVELVVLTANRTLALISVHGEWRRTRRNLVSFLNVFRRRIGRQHV